jgi:hypothetical protein
VATYTVRHIDTGQTLFLTGGDSDSDAAEGMSPDFQRPSIGKMVAATKGLARRKADGTLVLISVDEVPYRAAKVCE